MALDLTEAAAALGEFVREANRYLVEVAPWALSKDPGRRDELADVLYEAVEEPSGSSRCSPAPHAGGGGPAVASSSACRDP